MRTPIILNNSFQNHPKGKGPKKAFNHFQKKTNLENTYQLHSRVVYRAQDYGTTIPES